MKLVQDSFRYLVRFEVGEILPDVLIALTQDQQWTSGSLSGIGGVCDVTLGYYDLAAKQYIRFDVPGIVELVSLAGNLAEVDGKPFWHLHAAVSNREGEVRAGHLFRLKVAITVECWIQPGSLRIQRSKDDYSGLNLLSI